MGNILKYLPAAVVVIVALAAASVFGLGPYGLIREKPPVCENACVIAMGIDDDVNLFLGSGSHFIDFDVNDEVTRRLVGWLEEAPSVGEVEVYKYPAEIVIPERGVPGYADRAAAAVARAREIGQRHNARLVVIGQVLNDQSVALAFIDPQAPAQELTLGEYEVPTVGPPSRFASDFYAHMLAAAHSAQTLPALPPAPIGGAPPAPQVVAAAPSTAAATLPPPPAINASAPARTTTLPPRTTPTPQRTMPSTRATAPTPASTQAATPPPLAPSGDIVPARLIRDPQAAARLAAAYPQDALAAGATGEVDVQCQVNVDGSLRGCAVIRNTNTSYPFAQVALNHARTRRASPQTVGGVISSEGSVIIPYRFAVN